MAETWLGEDEDDATNATTNLCKTYTSHKYMTIALVAASTATFSTLTSLAVILVIVIFKKYNIFIQRLILYLCIAAFVNSVSIVFRYSRVDYNSTSSNSPMHTLCIATAFVDQTTLWSLSIAFCCMTVNLLLTVVFNKSTRRLEILYIFFIFLFPVTYNWVPFLKNSYGESGAWCWISSEDFNMANCTKNDFGMYLQYILWYIPHYVILGILLVVYVVIVANVIRKSYRWRGLYDMEVQTEKERMRELVMPIIFYPIGFFILNLFPLINRIYHTFAREPNYVLWLLHAIFSPLQGGFIAMVYVLDKSTIQRLNLSELRAYLFHRRTAIEEYPVKRGFTDSYGPNFPFLVDNESIESIEDAKLNQSQVGTTYGSIGSNSSTRKDAI